MRNPESTQLIDDFITQYRREFDFYNEAARLAHVELQSALGSNGIQAIVSYRAKDPERLRQKLYSRSGELKREYVNFKSIYDDIVDLAGVRVALYFPGSRGEVGKLIDKIFNVSQEVNFPKEGSKKNDVYTKEFSGYSAVHYRVSLRSEHSIYTSARIEIQVASLLMHAWSEVDHDLIYKPLQGAVSHEEYAILDQLNGLVLSGEIALRSLQRAIQTRLENYDAPFNNKYELSGFLLKNAAQIFPDFPADSGLGRVDILFRIMQIKQMNKTGFIKECVDRLDSDLERQTVSGQIISMLMWNEMRAPHLWNIIEKEFGVGQWAVNSPARYDEAARDALVEKYISRLQELEYVLAQYYPDEPQPVSRERLIELKAPGRITTWISRYRAIPNDISTRNPPYSADEVLTWLSELDGFIATIPSNYKIPE